MRCGGGERIGWYQRERNGEECAARGGSRGRGKTDDVAGVVGVRTLIMGCQTIMLIVYSVLTPSVCLHVYSCRLCRLLFLVSASSFFVIVVVVDAPLLPRRERALEETSNRFTRRARERRTKTAFLKARHGGWRGGSYLSGWRDKQTVARNWKNPADRVVRSSSAVRSFRCGIQSIQNSRDNDKKKRRRLKNVDDSQ